MGRISGEFTGGDDESEGGLFEGLPFLLFECLLESVSW